MQIIISHVNTDFDALASLFAAKKLFPEAKVVISSQQNTQVKRFLNIHRDTLDLTEEHAVDWSQVTDLILVDVASLSRIGHAGKQLNQDNITITIYDHHPRTEHNIEADYEVIEIVGATVTILIEEIVKRGIPISSFEATLYGLGIYTDTGSFTYQNTTIRDFKAATILMENGMNLEMIQRFSDYVLIPGQQDLLNQLFLELNTYEIDSLKIVISSYETDKFQAGLSAVTEKLLDIVGADAMLTIVKMKKHVYVVGRASAKRITLLPLMKKLGGGGHDQAAAATIKNGDFSDIKNKIINHLDLILKPAITAREMMSAPVKTLLPDTKVEEAGHLMYRYGHSGYPIVENGQIRGIITRRDLDKANHHGLGHAPVKAYMSTNVITIEPDTTLEEIQQLIIEHNIGRLPIIEDGKIIGIVTRTNIIEMLLSQQMTEDEEKQIVDNLETEMKKQLPKEIFLLLKDISKTAHDQNVSVYLIGGIVRDIFLKLPNDDIDIVVEGDGILFAKQLETNYGGKVISHEKFGTATWELPSNLKIDVTSARLEFYERPASLPDVEISTLKEDLYRRDFTINAMAIYLNKDKFGQVVDPFQGQEDLKYQKVRVLHNLSFTDDPTRILRAVRFETRLNFSMDDQTEKLAIHSIDLVKSLSAKRIVDEMIRLFNEVKQWRTIGRLYELKFWQQFGVSAASKKESQKHAKRLTELYNNNPSLTNHFEEKWFHYFVIPFYNSENIESAMPFALTKENLKFYHDVFVLSENTAWQHGDMLGDFERTLKIYSDVAILFILASENLPTEQLIIAYLEKRQQIPSFLTGDDLISAGLKPGMTFSKILSELDVAILNEEIKTREEALLWLEKQSDLW